MSIGRTSLLGAVTILVLLSVPVASASPPPYLSTGLVASGAKQATLSGYPGVAINYTDPFSSGIFAFVYLDLTNSAGQTKP